MRRELWTSQDTCLSSLSEFLFRVFKTLKLAPVVATVITAEDIQNMGTEKQSEALEKVQELYVPFATQQA